MKFWHAVFGVSLAWFLTVAPTQKVGLLRLLWDGPFAGWTTVAAYDSLRECESARKKLIAEEAAAAPLRKLHGAESMCLAGDDPRLEKDEES